MNRDEIKETIDRFFEVVEGNISVEDRTSNLELALDRLALAVQFADYFFDDSDYPDAPVREYWTLREVVSANFPNLGHYNVALDIAEKVGETSPAVGDAIDDICDIARDLEEVLWCWEHTSVDDALWHFKEGFGFHWGKHLRDLQLYLHAKEYGW